MDIGLIELLDLCRLFFPLAALIILDLSINLINGTLDDPGQLLDLLTKQLIRFQKLLADRSPLSLHSLYKLIQRDPVGLGCFDGFICVDGCRIFLSFGCNLFLQLLEIPFDLL